MSITAMLNTGLSALLANQSALRSTSTNVANVNTPGYVRRVITFETQTAGSLLGGVEIASVKRAVAQFLGGERNAAASSVGSADAANRFLDQLQATLGGVSGGRDPASRLSAINSELSALSTDPASSVRRAQLMQTLNDFTGGVSSLAKKIQDLRAQADAEIGVSIGRVNELIAKIADLNPPIQQATLSGDTATPLLDQRDTAIRELASLIEIRVEETASGRVNITTPSGYTLVNQNSSEATHFQLGAVGASSIFPSLTIVRRNASTGETLGQPVAFESHIGGGKLRGLLDLRDRTLTDVANQLGSLAAGAAEALNAAHNASSSWPAPSSLTGRQTGLLASDSLGFSGEASLAVVTAQGALSRRIDIDFDAGTLSVDGGAAVAFTQTVGGLTTALNTALGGSGTASFTDGVLSLSASGGNGIAVMQDPANPSDRAGRGFAHAFGLNDMLVSTVPTSFATGLSASDAHGFTNGAQVNFALRGPDGAVTRSFSYTVSGTTVGDLVTGLNASAAFRWMPTGN
jgi:flagellar hook-associated protein 1 FlgK